MSERRQKGSGDKRKWSRPMWLVVCLGVFVFVAWWVSPFFETAPQQGQCTFGTGSTALYERMKKEADQYLAEHGKIRLVNRSGQAAAEFSTALTAQLRDFAGRRDTLAERIAAMHALLVSYGMVLDWFKPKTKDGLNDGMAPIIAKYYIYLPKLSPWCIECYVMSAGAYPVYIKARSADIYDQFSGSLTRKTIIPDNVAPFPRGRRYEYCPLVPE